MPEEKLLKNLLFEIYSAGFEAGMQSKDIVPAYNQYFEENIKPVLHELKEQTV